LPSADQPAHLGGLTVLPTKRIFGADAMTGNKGALQQIGERHISFSLAFVGIFALTLFFLIKVDAVPDPIHPLVQNESTLSNANAVPVAQTTPEAPLRVEARDIGLAVSVSNPESADVATLDHALLSGAVRYPTSAMLGVDGTVLLFGHSSYLPVVHNQAYKAFDDIQKLKPGQIISVYSVDTEFRYSVTEVRGANANEDSVELLATGKHLTLVTCNSFATKSSRFIVTADLVGAYAI
jgi:LPXTG-site transpeptidase (sortase) family protein